MSVFLMSHRLMCTSSSCIMFWEKEKWTWQTSKFTAPVWLPGAVIDPWNCSIFLVAEKDFVFRHVMRADSLCTSILHGRIAGQGNVEDHEDAGRTTSKTGPNYQWLSAWELHRTDRMAWRAKVSLALAFDPREWGRTSPVLSSSGIGRLGASHS